MTSSLPTPNSGSTTSEDYLTAARQFLEVQFDTDNNMNARNVQIITIGSTVLPIAFGLLAIAEQAVPHSSEVSLMLAVVVYGLLIVCCWRASSIRGLEHRPNLAFLELYAAVLPHDDLQRWIAREYRISTELNTPNLDRKARWVGAAFTFLCLEGYFLSLAAFYTLL